MPRKTSSKDYTAAQIQVLEGLEPVRKRPGMYVGSTDINGIHQLVLEIVNNSIDEALVGACDRIEVTLNENGSITVIDNGRGIPIDIMPKYKVSALEIVMTKLHAGGKFGEGGYKVSGGLHGVGASVVNALSENLRVEVKRDSKLWVQEYQRGKPLEKVKVVKSGLSADDTGTTVIFTPDKEIFGRTIPPDFGFLSERLKQFAFLTRGVSFHLTDRKNQQETHYFFEGGIRSFVEALNRHKHPLHLPFYTHENREGIDVEISLQYNEGYNEIVLCFANNVFNGEGGTHLTGFRAGLTRTLNDFGREKGMIKEKDEVTGDDVREGLTAVVSVKLDIKNLQFEGQTKAKLGNAEVKPVVEQVLREKLFEFLEETPAVAQKIVSKGLQIGRAHV